jgi:hypothetical protein
MTTEQTSSRKTRSVVLVMIMGAGLLIFGGLVAVFGDINPKDHAYFINVATCIFFGFILLWWAISEHMCWGIGFETITMSVTVILAVVAILTLTHL